MNEGVIWSRDTIFVGRMTSVGNLYSMYEQLNIATEGVKYMSIAVTCSKLAGFKVAIVSVSYGLNDFCVSVEKSTLENIVPKLVIGAAEKVGVTSFSNINLSLT